MIFNKIKEDCFTMENVKVIIWGLGAMGGGIADMLLKKKGVDIVGVVDWEAKVGKSMYDFIKTPKGDRPDVIIGSAEDVIKPGAADIVMVCTDSFTKNVFPKIKFIVERGINAGKIVGQAAREMQGGGGGQAHFAQAGGKNPTGVRAAIDKVFEIIEG